MSKKLYVLAEGGLHNLAYLIRNGVIPHHYIQEPLVLKKYIPYLSESDDVLIIVQGLTDFKPIELYAIMHDLLNHDIRVKITVVSTVKLVKFPITYYLCEDDLFFSKIYGVTNEKVVDLDLEEGKKKNQDLKDKGKLVVNKVMSPFLDYGEEKVVDIVEDIEFTRKELTKEKSLYSSLIHEVDIYGGKNTWKQK